MKFVSTRGFTLIEFMVAITIFFIISTATYIPYHHYQKKGLLKQGVKEVVQSLYEAKNMSINGFATSTGNVSLGLYFDTSDGNNTQIQYFTYPHTFTGSQIGVVETGDIVIQKTKTLPEGVQIDSVGGHDAFLFFFQSISGEGQYYYWNPTKTNFSGQTIDIELSYKGSTSETLQATVQYYTQTYIADY